MGDSGWQTLVEDILHRLEELQVSVNGLISGNAKRLTELDRRITTLEKQAPKCPGECTERMNGLTQRFEDFVKSRQDASDKREALALTVANAVKVLPWWKLAIMAGAVVVVLAMLKRLNVI